MTKIRHVVRQDMATDILSRRPAASFVVLAYLFSWGVWIPASQLFSGVGPQFIAAGVGAFGPAVAATVLVVATGGSFRAWVLDLARWRLSPRWYLAALGLPVLFAAVETLVYAAFVGPIDPTLLPRRLVIWVGAFLVALLLTGGNEEPGWRGFLQPRLQRSYSALTAALLVGVVWMIWHVPLDLLLTELNGGGYDSTSLLSRLATLPLAIVYAWLYNSTDGSVIVAMLFHAGWNSSQALVPAPLPDGQVGGGPPESLVMMGTRVASMLVIVAVLLVVYDREPLATGDAHTQTDLHSISDT